MVIDDDEGLAVKASAANPPVGPPVVPTPTIMAELYGHLNKKPVEVSLPGATPSVVSPVEPFDHAPLRGRDHRIRPSDYFRLRSTVCKMPPLLM
jgi:hypothetical protein